MRKINLHRFLFFAPTKNYIHFHGHVINVYIVRTTDLPDKPHSLYMKRTNLNGFYVLLFYFVLFLSPSNLKRFDEWSVQSTDEADNWNYIHLFFFVYIFIKIYLFLLFTIAWGARSNFANFAYPFLQITPSDSWDHLKKLDYRVLDWR